MKKEEIGHEKMRTALIAATLIFLLAACAAEGIDVSKLEKSEYDAADQSREVVMTLEDTAVAANTETLNVHFANSSSNEYTFGMEPRLEVETGGVWYIVNTAADAVWIEIAYVLPAGGAADMEFPLRSFYGTLAAGHYRIVKPLYAEAGNTFAIAEFTAE